MIKQFESFFYGLAGLTAILAACYLVTNRKYGVALPLSYVGAGLAIVSLDKVHRASKERDISGIPTVGIVFAVFALMVFVPYFGLLTYVSIFGFDMFW